MFFIISKVLEFLLDPIIWVIFFLIVAVRAKQARKRKVRLLWALCLTYVFSNAFILDEVMRLWETQAIQTEAVKPSKVAVILGGFTQFDPAFKRVEFSDGVDRLLMGLKLYRQGKVEKLLITGGSSKLINRKFKEGKNVEHYLLSIGFPKEALVVEPEARNTHENAVYSKDLLKELGYGDQSVVLITSAIHMRRATACFVKQGINFQAYAVDRKAGPRKYAFDHLFIPNSQTLSKWDSLMHEIVGYITYWLRGYI